MRSAFKDATGLTLKFVPAGAAVSSSRTCFDENPFCAQIKRNASVCAACGQIQKEIRRRMDRKFAPQEVCCFAGLTELAVPVIVGGEHIATLVGGQVFRKKPARNDFQRLATRLRRWGMNRELKRAERTYFQTAVLSEKQWRGAVRLLVFIANSLAEFSERRFLFPSKSDPLPVLKAKQFVQSNLSDRLRLEDAARHVSLSRTYFCKVFRATTRMPFTEYVARVRVEKAKDLLSDPRLQITEVAGAAGFNSISQFNRLFHRHTGGSPSDYRARLKRLA